MTELIYFLGRFHVLLLHLPIGILSLAVVLEILARFRRFRALEVAVAPAWIAGALSAIATTILGFMHATESGFDDSAGVEAHRWAGVLLTASACVIAVLRLRLAPVGSGPRSAASFAQVLDRLRPTFMRGSRLDQIYGRVGWIAASVITVYLLTITGHRGGNLTHGETYLVEYAPTPLRQLLGLPSSSTPRGKPTDLASADIYLDVVAPALKQRCASCHNADKLKGGLNLASYESMMKGGKDAKAVVPGDLQASDLYRRITLPDDHEDYMPADGKTPLTPQQKAAIGWWISQGAPKSAAIGTLKVTPEVQPALAEILGLPAEGVQLASGPPPPGSGAAAPEGPPPKVEPGDPQATSALESSGFVLRPISKDSNLLDVNLFASRNLTDADVANLAKIGPQLRTLIVRNAGLTDAQLKALGALPNLVLLRAEGNPITDAGAQAIAQLQSLRSLNLYGTRITDAGLDTLSGLPNLQRLFIWQTKVTEAGIRRVQAAKPALLLTSAAPFTVVPKPSSTGTSGKPPS